MSHPGETRDHRAFVRPWWMDARPATELTNPLARLCRRRCVLPPPVGLWVVSRANRAPVGGKLPIGPRRPVGDEAALVAVPAC
jgi:hypothetical protein